MSSSQSQTKALSFIPVNLKLVQDITQKGEPFTLDSEPVEWIDFVSRVTAYRETNKAIFLTFQDEFAEFYGIIYRKDENTQPRALKGYHHADGGYAHVIGNIANFEDGPKCIVQAIENVKIYEYVHYHRTKVLWSYLVRNKVLHCPLESLIEIPRETPKIAPKVNDTDMEHLSLEQAEVLNVIRKNANPSGMHREEIVGIVKNKVRKLDEVLEELVNYGFLYTESDNNIYFYT